MIGVDVLVDVRGYIYRLRLGTARDKSVGLACEDNDKGKGHSKRLGGEAGFP